MYMYIYIYIYTYTYTYQGLQRGDRRQGEAGRRHSAEDHDLRHRGERVHGADHGLTCVEKYGGLMVHSASLSSGCALRHAWSPKSLLSDFVGRPR